MKTFKVEIPKGYEIDTEKSTFENIVFRPTKEYVDLGLPSGTLWADSNEEGYYSYQDAINTFGENNLPKLSDYADLYCYCKWRWDDEKKGMVVTGPNGNSIFLPALGFRYPFNDKTHSIGKAGYYWSGTSYLDKGAFDLCFYEDIDIYTSGYNECSCEFPIRKIRRK